MSAIPLIGGVTVVLSEAARQRIMLLVAFAAGSLIGGTLLHLIPAALSRDAPAGTTLLGVLERFAVFFAIEQFLHWHHCQRASTSCTQPLT
jgi:zinc and cadmium transporter